jgi:hypothetical protein
MPRPAPELLPVAVRAYSRTNSGKARRSQTRRRGGRRRTPRRTLVFDTETTTDAVQQLNFGAARYYIDRWDQPCLGVLVQEVLFSAPNQATRDPDAHERLVAYARGHNSDASAGYSSELRLIEQDEFLEDWIYLHGHEHGATIVGFNLPFDVARLASHAGDARGRYSGGHSLRLFEHAGTDHPFRPRIVTKSIDSRRALMGFTRPVRARGRSPSRFCDLRTLTFAYTNEATSLERACELFDVPFKKAAVQHGDISEEYIDYGRADVAATAELCRALLVEHDSHPIDLDPADALSPASIGKAYLNAFNIEPLTVRQPDFPADILGYGMAAFFGGRAETHIRKTPLPVVYCDFLSMYPTVNALMRSWHLLTAARIEVHDATADVIELLTDQTLLERCFEPSLWPDLLTLVEIEPEGDVLPVRARYDPASPDYGIGLNHYWLDGAAWYTLADLITATLNGDRIPRVMRAIRLVPLGTQSGLRSVKLRGTVAVDPRNDDFFRVVIEERNRVRHDTTRSIAERQRLDRFLKVLANATSYGILAEFRRHELAQPVEVTINGPRSQAFTVRSHTPEEPGPHCFPPLAACITGGARLMLALLERLVNHAGCPYVLCDTDSMAIPATPAPQLVGCQGGTQRLPDGRAAIRTLSFEEVEAIRARFESLNPYDRAAVPGSILEIESENYEPDTGQRRQLWCYAISAKRYVLYNRDGDYVTLRKRSEHGLGHLLGPTHAVADWIDEFWRYVLCRELGLSCDEPDWLDEAILTRFTVSGATLRHWFDRVNEGRRYADQIKPGNFLLVAHPHPFGGTALPFAPYQRGVESEQVPWYDRATGEPIAITTRFDGTHTPGVVAVKSYRDHLANFLARPESKSAGPSGEPVGLRTRGVLQRRHVRGLWPPLLVGKETNRLDDRQAGVVNDPALYRSEYRDPHVDGWSTVLEILRTMDLRELARRSGLSTRHLRRILTGTSQPREVNRCILTRLAFSEPTGHEDPVTDPEGPLRAVPPLAEARGPIRGDPTPLG